MVNPLDFVEGRLLAKRTNALIAVPFPIKVNLGGTGCFALRRFIPFERVDIVRFDESPDDVLSGDIEET